MVEGGGGEHTNICIFFDGGGQSGVIGNAIFDALDSIGIARHADVFIGSSVGAYGLAYILFGKSKEGNSIFTRFYCSGTYINIWRALVAMPVLNLDFVEKIVTQVEPAPFDAMRISNIALYALVWSRYTKTSEIKKLTGLTEDSAMRILRDTSRVPGIATVTRSDEYLDGFMAFPDMARLMQGAGISHILHISNVSSGARYGYLSLALYRAYLYYIDRDAYVQLRKPSTLNQKNFADHGIVYEQIQYAHAVGNLCKDADVIKSEYARVYAHMCKYLQRTEMK